MKRVKALVMVMVMVMALTGSVPTVEAKTKTSITVANKTTGKKIGKKVTLKTGEKIQLKVKYGKKVVTKKAKYKTSNKNIATVSKKGKITAKAAGTCTVKVTYKKKTKKIKVVVKAVEVKTEESTTEAATKPKAEKKMATQEELDKFMDNYKLYSDPHPECDHEWYPIYWSDTFLSVDDFRSMYKEHLTLREVHCPKCDTMAETKPISITESINFTNDELTATIDYYLNGKNTGLYCEGSPRHKCKKVQRWSYSSHRFSSDVICEICHAGYDD